MVIRDRGKRGQGGGQEEGCGCLNLVKYIGGAAKSRMTASATKPPKKVFQDPLSDAPVEPFTTKRHRKATVEKTCFLDHFRKAKDAYNDASKIPFFRKSRPGNMFFRFSVCLWPKLYFYNPDKYRICAFCRIRKTPIGSFKNKLGPPPRAPFCIHSRP